VCGPANASTALLLDRALGQPVGAIRNIEGVKAPLRRPMPEDSPHAKAHQAIGAYFSAFSALEHELGEAIKVVLRLQNHESGDAVVATLREVFKKIQLVWTAVLVAKNADGSETTKNWKDKARNTMTAISRCNEERVFVAHSRLEPQTDGSVVLDRLQVAGGELKGKGETWGAGRL
jgi:hypothetical protein